MIISLLLTAMLAAPAPPATQTASKPAKEKLICRMDTATGSIMPKRTCHTMAEWQQIDRQNQDAAGDFYRTKNSGN